MFVFFWRMILCLELSNTGILNRWFSPDLTVIIVLTISKHFSNSISSVSNSIGILLVVLLKLTFHGILTSLPTGTMVELDIVDTIISSFSDVLMSLLSVETLLRLVFIKLFVWELIRALVLLFLFTSSFIALKPRIVSCNAFLITTKGICNRWDSSSPWHVS